MKIANWTIDSAYFQDEVNKFISENFIYQNNIISITQHDGFTTLWYFEKIRQEL